MLVILTARSAKAKNILVKCLKGDPLVSLEQLRDGEIFVVSPDRSFSTWIATKGDPDWGYAFTRSRPSPGPD